MQGKRDFLSLADYSRDEVMALLERGAQMKSGRIPDDESSPLSGKSIAMIFEKASTRTRVSFEVGIRQLGGYPIFLSKRDIQMGRGESIGDTARVLGRYVDAIVIRTYGQEVLEELAGRARVPVINALSDLLHPCQLLADLMTAQEAGLDVENMKAAWIGDGNNMANSWINAAKILGFRLVLACPEGYDPDIEWASGNIELKRDPREAVLRADLVSTDVWASMGQEDEADERMTAFKGYQVNMDLLRFASKPVRVLHCLPAHRGEEITEEVMESDHSLIWNEAENRLHVQKALLEMLLG